jgi:predicted TIM-barrel fold metal-dependent hydrolase
MIVDAHCHIWPEQMPEGSLLKVMENTADSVGFKNKDNFFKASIDRLIAEKDAAGIDKTLLISVDFELAWASSSYSARDLNDVIGEAYKRYPDRIIPYAGIDPRRGAGAIEELKRCVEVLGCKGMKLWPLTGFAPDHIEYYPLYEEAARLGVNIVVHTGMGPPDSYLKYCRPVYVDKVAVDFREIVFIMAHFGAPWVDEALAVAGKNGNVYADISSWQHTHAVFPLALYQMLSMAKLMHGSVRKVLFGTDFPCFAELYSQKAWVQCIKDLEYPAPLQIMGLPEITDQDKELILGKNAKAALKLE